MQNPLASKRCKKQRHIGMCLFPSYIVIRSAQNSRAVYPCHTHITFGDWTYIVCNAPEFSKLKKKKGERS